MYSILIFYRNAFSGTDNGMDVKTGLSEACWNKLIDNEEGDMYCEDEPLPKMQRQSATGIMQRAIGNRQQAI